MVEMRPDFFLGRWKVERVIEDELHHQRHTLSGEVSFTEVSLDLASLNLNLKSTLTDSQSSMPRSSFLSLLYEESLIFQEGEIAGQQANQREYWIFSSDSRGVGDLIDLEAEDRQNFRDPQHERCEIFFSDKRPFFSLTLSEPKQCVEHLCSPDIYRGEFLFSPPDRFEFHWVVSGPKKRYTSSSKLVKEI